MKNVKILIEYDGTHFFGWQYQPQERTIQGEIEEALERLTNEKLRIIGAGRTDQGVHALGQVANFHTASHLELRRLQQGINSLTPDDIYVKKIAKVRSDFHSRFSAKSKVYRYQMIREPFPLKMRYNWFVKYKLNVVSMKEVIPYFLGEHDFRNLSAQNDEDNTVCTVHTIDLTEENSRIIMTIEGNRFLRKMVRGIVGFIHDVGRGRFPPDYAQRIFEGTIRDIYFAPPHGLILVEVKY